MSLAEHTLVVYLFTTVIGEDTGRAEAGYRQLCQAWVQLAARLNLPEPAKDARVPGDPDPVRPDMKRSALLAGRAAPASPALGLREMWCNQVHDVVCLSLTLSREGMPDSGWAGLHDEWTRARSGLELDDVLGFAEVFTASTGQPDPVPANGHTAALVRIELPASVESSPGWESVSAGSAQGLALYQLSTHADEQPFRRLAVVAPSGQVGDAELSAWVWQAGLGRLAMCLLNAAKLHHQAGVVRQDRPVIAQLRLEANQALLDLQPIFTNPAGYTPSELRGARTEVARLQAKTSGLIDTLARVVIIRRTIAIAADNIAELTRGVTDPAHTELFDADQRLAQRLDRDLDDEHTYLYAASRRAKHVVEVAAEELEHHQEQREQADRHRQNQFTLIQTAILGTVVIALTAVQAFGVRVNLPASPAAVIATLGALAFLLYTYSLRRADFAQHLDSAASAWVNILVSLAAGATVAGLAWIMATVDVQEVALPAATSTVVVTAAAFVVAAALSWILLRHRRRTK